MMGLNIQQSEYMYNKRQKRTSSDRTDPVVYKRPIPLHSTGWRREYVLAIAAYLLEPQALQHRHCGGRAQHRGHGGALLEAGLDGGGGHRGGEPLAPVLGLGAYPSDECDAVDDHRKCTGRAAVPSS